MSFRSPSPLRLVWRRDETGVVETAISDAVYEPGVPDTVGVVAREYKRNTAVRPNIFCAMEWQH